MESRDWIVEDLVRRQRLWPLIDHTSCRLCAIPRRHERAQEFLLCRGCQELRSRYGLALDDLLPITYTTPHWPLGTALREFKDRHNASPSHRLARRFGAVLSSFLEQQLDRIQPPWGPDAVILVPSSKPTVASALRAAHESGWWTPDLRLDLVAADPTFPRQRAREGQERRIIEGKWRIERDAFANVPHVVVLDDMTTSGATLHSLALALRTTGGASSVTAVVLARNVGEDGEWILPLLEDEVQRRRTWSPSQIKHDVMG